MELKEKIVEILQEYAKWSVSGINVNNFADKILVLIGKELFNGMEVEEECSGCQGFGYDAYGQDKHGKCKGTGKIRRPTMAEELQEFIDFYFSPDHESNKTFSFGLKSGGRLVLKKKEE